MLTEDYQNDIVSSLATYKILRSNRETWKAKPIETIGWIEDDLRAAAEEVSTLFFLFWVFFFTI